jgi:hypothetical protein
MVVTKGMDFLFTSRKRRIQYLIKKHHLDPNTGPKNPLITLNSTRNLQNCITNLCWIYSYWPSFSTLRLFLKWWYVDRLNFSMLCGSWSVIKSFRWKGSSFKRSFQHFVFIFSCSMAWNTLKTYYYFHNKWIFGGIRGKDILNWMKKYKITSYRIIQNWLNGARIRKDSMQSKGWTIQELWFNFQQE